MKPPKNGRAWYRLRKEANARKRRWLKRFGRAGAAVTALWLHFEDEATSCPACGSTRLSLLDVLRVRGDMTGRRLTFLAGCEECGLLFCNPLPQPDKLEGFYGDTGVWAQEHAERAAHLAAVHERRLRRRKKGGSDVRTRKRPRLLEALEPYIPVTSPAPGARAIDFGCGEGKLLNWLQDFGWDTFGIEPSIDVAFLRHHRLAAPPQDGSFDVAILHHVLEHVPNPLEILRQLAATLRQDGRLFISVPRLDTLPQHGDFHYCINGRNHLVAFTEACLQSLLARAGFEVIGRLHGADLDQALTDGVPLRMRLVARRTDSPPVPPAAPLAAARHALEQYARTHSLAGRRIRLPIPLRLRGGWMQRGL
jgi:SAM-dependent methyltransferase